VRTSPFRSAAYSLRCKSEKFEAILFPLRNSHRCLRTDRRALVPEAAAVHPKCANSSSGAHARPSRAKANTPRCSAISTTSYCRRPRPASCTPLRCHRRRHRHCLCRARWCIDRPSHRAHPRWGAGDHCILVFNEEGFDSREVTSLRIPETGQHSKGCFVSGGVPHPRNLISYPLNRQMPADVAVAAHLAHGRASTA
jgi:hypothetical protein